MKTWPIFLWIVFSLAILYVLAILIFLGVEYSNAGILLAYVIGISVISILFCIRGHFAREVHIHHYSIGAFVTAIICYQSIFLTIVNGLFNGMMIEGGARWGYDTTFLSHHPKDEDP